MKKVVLGIIMSSLISLFYYFFIYSADQCHWYEEQRNPVLKQILESYLNNPKFVQEHYDLDIPAIDIKMHAPELKRILNKYEFDFTNLYIDLGEAPHSINNVNKLGIGYTRSYIEFRRDVRFEQKIKFVASNRLVCNFATVN